MITAYVKEIQRLGHYFSVSLIPDYTGGALNRATALALKIERVVRPMRGQSKAHLVTTSSGHSYVCKSPGNPEGNISLVCEWVINRIMNAVHLPTPPLKLLSTTENTRVESGCTFVCSASEYHLGSAVPASSTDSPIWDFLPSALLNRVENYEDFLRVLVLDTALRLQGSRQAIFTSAPARRYKAWFIDHGSYEDVQGNCRTSAVGPMYISSAVYSLTSVKRKAEVCSEFANRLLGLDLSSIEESAAVLPDEWFLNRDVELRSMFSNLSNRIKSVQPISDIVAAAFCDQRASCQIIPTLAIPIQRIPESLQIVVQR